MWLKSGSPSRMLPCSHLVGAEIMFIADVLKLLCAKLLVNLPQRQRHLLTHAQLLRICKVVHTGRPQTLKQCETQVERKCLFNVHGRARLAKQKQLCTLASTLQCCTQSLYTCGPYLHVPQQALQAHFHLCGNLCSPVGLCSSDLKGRQCNGMMPAHVAQEVVLSPFSRLQPLPLHQSTAAFLRNPNQWGLRNTTDPHNKQHWRLLSFRICFGCSSSSQQGILHVEDCLQKAVKVGLALSCWQYAEQPLRHCTPASLCCLCAVRSAGLQQLVKTLCWSRLCCTKQPGNVLHGGLAPLWDLRSALQRHVLGSRGALARRKICLAGQVQATLPRHRGLDPPHASPPVAEPLQAQDLPDLRRCCKSTA